MTNVRLSVVIPAYNEEKRLPKTLRAVSRYLARQTYTYEIVVVNDGSNDNTSGVVQNLRSAIKHLRLIDNKKNLGKGFAVRQGMLKVRGEYRVFMDADNSTSINHVEGMWPAFAKGHGVVICSRDLRESVIAVSQARWRQRLGDLFNLMVQMFSGLWGIWDTQCGFKGFSAKAAKEIFSRGVINRWAFDVEVLVIARKLGYGIREIPVTWVNDPESKVKFSGMVKMLWEVLEISFNSLKGKYD